RGRAPADEAAAQLRGAEERHRPVAVSAAALREEGTRRLCASVGNVRDDRDQPPRRGKIATRRSTLLRPYLRQQDAADREDQDSGLDGGAGEHRCALSTAHYDAGSAPQRVRSLR